MCQAGNILDIRKTAVTKTDKNTCLHGAGILAEWKRKKREKMKQHESVKYVSFPSQPFRELDKNVDSRNQPRLHGSSSMGGVQESAFSRSYRGTPILTQPAQHCTWWSCGVNMSPYSNQLKSFYSKGALVGNLAFIQASLLLLTFFSMTTWSLSAYQDEIADNRGLENS